MFGLNMILGDRVRMLREDRDMSRDDLARVLELGTATIARIENGYGDTKIEIAAKMAAFFGVSLDYLAGLTDSKTPHTPSDLSEKEKAMVAAIRRDDVKAALKLLIAEQV